MDCRKVFENYYWDVNNLADLLNKLTNSYRLLVGSAQELSCMALSKKDYVRDALKRANALGKVIDNIIRSLDICTCTYLDYCEIKADIIACRIQIQHIQEEIDACLKIKQHKNP